MTPSLAVRTALVPALAMPFWRSQSLAFSISPLVASRARFASIIPAPVASLSFLTCSAEIGLRGSGAGLVAAIGCLVLHFEACEASNGDVLAEARNRLFQDLVNRSRIVLGP